MVFAVMPALGRMILFLFILDGASDIWGEWARTDRDIWIIIASDYVAAIEDQPQ